MQLGISKLWWLQAEKGLVLLLPGRKAAHAKLQLCTDTLLSQYSSLVLVILPSCTATVKDDLMSREAAAANAGELQAISASLSVAILSSKKRLNSPLPNSFSCSSTTSSSTFFAALVLASPSSGRLLLMSWSILKGPLDLSKLDLCAEGKDICIHVLCHPRNIH